jgi:hypothetical protein
VSCASATSRSTLVAPSHAPRRTSRLISLDVEWIDAETLSQSMKAPESAAPLLLDVRSEEEFAVSHLRGAVRVAMSLA